MKDHYLSIITPTYNRGYILGNLFESLIRQTNNRFEWIIIDDGSNDNTNELVDGWMTKNNGFEIRYFRKNNGGKHKALNFIIPHSKNEFVYIIDSDDYMKDNAVELIYKWIDTISGKTEFAAVSGLRGKKNGMGIHGDFPFGVEYVDATNIERRKRKLLGDKAEVYRRDLLIKYPFPEFENESFLSEIAVWDKIAGDGYKIRWFGEVICLCEYLEDGLTKNDGEHVKLNNFQGYTYIERQNFKLKRFPENYLAVGRYIALAKKKNMKYYDVKQALGIKNYVLILGLVFSNIRALTKTMFRKNY